MGASQSVFPTEAAVTAVAVAGAIAYGYFQLNTSDGPQPSAGKPSQASTSSSKKNKRKKGAKINAATSASASSSHGSIAPAKVNPPTSQVVPFPAILPGQFDTELQDDLKSKEPKKKKKSAAKPAASAKAPTTAPALAPAPSSSDTTPEGSSDAPEPVPRPARPASIVTTTSGQVPLTRPQAQSTTSIDTDGSWTRVESKKRSRDAQRLRTQADDTDGGPSSTIEVTTSDAGATTPVTGTSSPIADRADDDDEEQGFLAGIARTEETRRPLAERLLPKPRKTGVDDMLETPDYPQLARVMRVQPQPDEKPASGFSWGDYEDVQVTGAGTGTDADGEDDGWGVVRRSGRGKTDRTPSSSAQAAQKATETMTKKQRQNATKREAQKLAKAEAEAERLAALAKHRRELERAKMSEQASQRNKSGRP